MSARPSRSFRCAELEGVSALLPNCVTESPDNSKRVKCRLCSSLILPETAEQHRGWCIRCIYSPPCRSVPTLILLDSEGITFAIPAEPLLAALETTKGIGGPGHPNAVELEAQRALIRHALSVPVNRKLNDDHWGRTSEVAGRLFESGIGKILTADAEFRFTDIKRRLWRAGREPQMSRGGYVYLTADGREIDAPMV